MVDRIGRFFSSLKLTVWLLLILAAVLAYGTIFEAENGTPAVRVHLWRTWKFDSLLLVLAANIVGCTYYRQPKRTSRWAYLLLHQSILIIFAGGLIGRWYGMEGQLQLREGEAKAEITSEANVLNVTWQDKSGKTYDSYQFPTEIVDAFVKRHELDHVWPMPKRGVNVRVDRFYPDFSQVEGAVPGGQGDPAAVQLTFTHLKDSVDHWVFAGKDGIDPVPGMQVTLREGTPPALKPEELKGNVGGVLELTGPGHSFHANLDITGQPQTIAVANTPYTVKVERVFSHLTLKDKTPIEDPSAPENPAVLFILEGPGLSDRRIVFANYPDFDEMHGRKKSGVGANYRFKSRELQIWRDPKTEKLAGRFVGAGAVVTGPLKVGKSYPVKEIDGLAFSVSQVLPAAKPGLVARNKSNELRRPGMRVNIQNDVGSEQLWLPFGETRTLAFGDAKATFEYTKVQIPMKFDLKLKKFTVGRHPGTNQPASFSSDVLMEDKELKVTGDRTISMNEPLVHRGYTFYQSSYVEGTPMISIFQVAYDPGGPVAYIGFFGFMAGLFCIIWSRPKRISAAAAALPGRE